MRKLLPKLTLRPTSRRRRLISKRSSMAKFNPTEQAASVRDRLWLHLAGSSVPSDLEPIVEDLFRLSRGDLRRLAAARLALRPQTSETLMRIERLLRELPASAISR